MSSSANSSGSGSGSSDSESSGSLDEESPILARPIFSKRRKTLAVQEPTLNSKLAMARAEQHVKVEQNEAKLEDFDGVDDTDDVEPEKEYELWRNREKYRKDRDRKKLAVLEEEKEEAVRRNLGGSTGNGEESGTAEKSDTITRKSANLGSYYAQNIDEKLLSRNYENVEDNTDHSRPTRFKK